MAIRPVDLQLAYIAAPQNAAILSSSQQASQAAQHATAAAFAAEVAAREEQIEEPDKAHGTKVRAREEREHPDDPQHRRRRGTPYEQDQSPSDVLGLSGEGEHLIDVTA